MNKKQIELVGMAYLAGQRSKSSQSTKSSLSSVYERPRMVHKVPRRPIRLEGDRCQSRIVQRFDGHPLYWVLDKNALEGGEISVFTRPDTAKLFRDTLFMASEEILSNKNEISESGQVLTEGFMSGGYFFGGYVDLYEHINYQGVRWTFWASWGNIPDFTKVFPTLWWTSNINDRVSSVDSNIKANPPGTLPWTVLYEHINFEGSQLWIPNGLGLVDSLVDYGWNDIASSMSYEV